MTHTSRRAREIPIDRMRVARGITLPAPYARQRVRRGERLVLVFRRDGENAAITAGVGLRLQGIGLSAAVARVERVRLHDSQMIVLGGPLSPWCRKSGDSVHLRRSRRAAAAKEWATIPQAWRWQWTQVIPFCAYPAAAREIIYTTNPRDNLHIRLRKIVKNRRPLPERR
jgi:hypothetical protein